VVWVMQFSMAPPVPSGGQTACRFGYNCRRPDCYFAHPEGRAIANSGGGTPPPGSPGSPTIMPPGFVMRNQVGLGMAPPLPPTFAGAPGGRGGGGGGGGNARPCKFGIECTRGDCYFSHPEGRSVAAGAAGGRGGGGRGGAGGRGGGRGAGGGGAERVPVPVTDPNQVLWPSPLPPSPPPPHALADVAVTVTMTASANLQKVHTGHHLELPHTCMPPCVCC
jgi:hypothetical protein